MRPSSVMGGGPPGQMGGQPMGGPPMGGNPPMGGGGVRPMGPGAPG